MAEALKRLVTLMLALAGLFGFGVATAQERARESLSKKLFDSNVKQKKNKLPPSGLIAGSKTGEYGGTQIDGPWGGIDTSGSKKDPITGSCAKSDPFNWKVKVFNNTKDRYNVNLGLIQFDVRNRELKTDTFFAAIPAGQKMERVYAAHPDATQCAVKLNNWKMIPRKKSAEELQREIEKKKRELEELQSEAGAS